VSEEAEEKNKREGKGKKGKVEKPLYNSSVITGARHLNMTS
jgi:hypothetical protein